MSTIPTTALVIIDGFGSNPDPTGNAILSANTPNLDYLWNHYPHTLLKAAEEEVGLSFGEMGNSEVGHLTIGTGRVIYQSLQRITTSLEDSSFFTNTAFINATNHVKQYQSTLHLMGMVSVAGVHAHLDHMIALIRLASEQKVPRLCIHLILDGRDSGPKDAPLFLTKIQEAISKYKIGYIASISGRAYAMDRNKNWERTLLYYNTLQGQNSPTTNDPITAIEQNYRSNRDDENLLPTIVLDNNSQPIGILKENDALIMSNYREDRARQIIQLLTHTQPAPKVEIPKNLFITTMTQYDKHIPAQVAFPPILPKNTLSDVLHQQGIPQSHISETEKYAHVTYFFNGGREITHPDEKFINIPSPKPETFVISPQMAAPQVAQEVIKAITTTPNQFIIVNFANPDMIAHTGNFNSTVTAVNLIDQLIAPIWQAISAQNGYLFITADHGNCESMIDPATKESTKDHTSNPVPFIVANNNLALPQPGNDRVTLNSQVSGLLADIAPTILSILNLPIPPEMTGAPLFTTAPQSQ